MLLMNKGELAAKLGVSTTTLASWIERWPDLPVARRGSNGVEWQFDAVAVASFIQQKRQERAAAERQKADDATPLLATLMDGQSQPDSLADRITLLRAIRLEDQVAKERSFLVDRAQMREAMERIQPLLEAKLRELPHDLIKQHNLTPAIAADCIQAVERALADHRRRMADAGFLSPVETGLFADESVASPGRWR